MLRCGRNGIEAPLLSRLPLLSVLLYLSADGSSLSCLAKLAVESAVGETGRGNNDCDAPLWCDEEAKLLEIEG